MNGQKARIRAFQRVALSDDVRQLLFYLGEFSARFFQLTVGRTQAICSNGCLAQVLTGNPALGALGSANEGVSGIGGLDDFQRRATGNRVFNDAELGTCA